MCVTCRLVISQFNILRNQIPTAKHWWLCLFVQLNCVIARRKREWDTYNHKIKWRESTASSKTNDCTHARTQKLVRFVTAKWEIWILFAACDVVIFKCIVRDSCWRNLKSRMVASADELGHMNIITRILIINRLNWLSVDHVEWYLNDKWLSDDKEERIFVSSVVHEMFGAY